MDKIFSKFFPLIVSLICILFFYFIFFFGVTYNFKSKTQIDPEQTTEIVNFNKSFNKSEIESINILSDTSNIIIEQSNSEFIEIFSSYNEKSLLSVQLKRKILTIKQYSNGVQDLNVEKYLKIKLPSKDFKKLKVSSPILNIKVENCNFQLIDITSKISTIDLKLEKSPKKTKLYIDTGNISLTVPNSKNNSFEIFSLKSKLIFYNKNYIGFVNEKFGNGNYIFDIHCVFGLVVIY